MNFSNFKNNYLDFSHVAKLFSVFRDKYSKVFFLLFSAVILMLGIYLWYEDMYYSDWSSEKKEEYKKSQNKKIELKEEELKNIIKENSQRKSVYDSALKSVKNIFTSYQKDEPVKPADMGKTSSGNSNSSTKSSQLNSIIP
jgi:cell division protein FtsL